MTITLFITMLTLGAGVTALLTEAIKKAYTNSGKEYSANVIALINALVVGCGGTAVLYMLQGIPWTTNNIICLILMGVAVWVASMIGYDKLLQLLKQIADVKTSASPNEESGADIKPNSEEKEVKSDESSDI